MDYARTFTSSQGRFVRFRMYRDQFLIERGKGSKFETQDIFPMQKAVEMATQILQVTGQYMDDNDSVKSLVKENTLDESQAVELMKMILNQAYDKDRLRQQALQQLGSSENSPVQNNLNAIMSNSKGEVNNQYRIAPKQHTKWVLLQHIYDQYGFEPFSPREFKEWFEENHGSRNTAGVHLMRFKDQRKIIQLSVDEVGESQYKYQKNWYKLNKAQVGNLLNEFDGFAVPQNPYYTENPPFAEA